MFWNRNKIRKDMLPNLRPTSKASLKMQCLLTCNGDLEKASKLYDFMIKDMEDLPMFDVQPPTTMQQDKETIGQGIGWLKENQNEIIQGIEWIRSMFGRGGGMPPSGAAPSPIPPIN